jgi:hypothetical protein
MKILTTSLTYYRYGTRLVASGDITTLAFFVSFMSVFFSAQATSQIFQFSTSQFSTHPVITIIGLRNKPSADRIFDRYNERKERHELYFMAAGAPPGCSGVAREPRQGP